MSVLVAGGAGFIGSHLIDALLQSGEEVICIDNFYNGKKENLAHIRDNNRFIFYEQDLCDLEKLKSIFQENKIQYVYHLAANSDIQESANNPIIEYQNTYTTTFNLLECMRLFSVKRIFFASTSAVYGDNNGNLVSESAKLCPISYYGGAKLGSEAMIEAYAYMNDMSALIFRFPNLIGPRLTHGVIYDFINKLKENPEELTILGDGTQSKPYIHISDLIDAIVKLGNCDKGIHIYNIGVETQTDVTTIANIVCEKLGLKNVKYKYTGGRGGWKGDVPVFAYSLDKIHSTGWKAKFTSEEAVVKTCEEVISCKRL